MTATDKTRSAEAKPDLAPGIAERLRNDILNGAFPPGSRLPAETALAASFGVSRPTLREALHRLAAQGFIETRRGARGGAFVTSGAPAGLARPMAGLLSLATIRGGLTVGALLGAYAGSLNIALDGPIGSPEALAALDSALDALRSATTATLSAAHSAFHLALCDTAGNPLTGLVARAFAEASGTALTPPDPTVTDCSRLTALCGRLTDAISSGDGGQVHRNVSDWANFVAARSDLAADTSDVA